jgi:hypothetical protein
MMPQYDPDRFTIDRNAPREFDPDRFSIVDEKTTPQRPATSFFRGANTGLADVAGLPVDAVTGGLNMALRQFNQPEIEDPVGGSGQLRRALSGRGMGYESLQDLPEGDRPFATAGEAIGASAPFAALPFALARQGVQQGGRRIRDAFSRPAREQPGTTGAVEASAATGAGVGAFLAETHAPGDATARALSEMAGSVINPGQYAARFGNKVGGRVYKAVARTFSREFQETEAGQYLRSNLENFGENVHDIQARIARNIEDAPEGVKLDTAAASESDAMAAIASRVSRDSQRTGSQINRQRLDAAEMLRDLADGLSGSGNMEDLMLAARLRQKYFEEILDMRVQGTVSGAEESARPLASRGTGAARDASRRASETLDDALGDANRAEFDLWDKVPKNVPVNGQGVRQALEEVQRRMIPTRQALPKAFAEFVESTADGVTSRDMLNFRRDMLEEARIAAARGQNTRAGIYNRMADGALDDLSVIPGEVADTARAYSLAKNNVFSRTFAGEATARTPEGGQAIQDDLLLHRAMGGGGDQAAVRMEDLRRASDFDMPEAGVEAWPTNRPNMREAQQDFVREAASASLEGGRVNPSRLEDFMRNNQGVLEEFPGLRGQMRQAVDAELAARAAEQNRTANNKLFQDSTAFGQLMGGSQVDPSITIGQVLRGNDPVREYGRMARLTQSGQLNTAQRQAARDGLLTATLDDAFRQSGGVDALNFTQLDRALNQPIARGQPSRMDLMRQNRIITSEQKENMRRIVDAGKRAERAAGSQARIDQLINDPDQLADLITRVVGARVASAGAAGTTGATIVAAGAGSRAARNLLQKIPGRKVQDLVALAMQDPQLASRLLKRTRGLDAIAEDIEFVTAAMTQAGLISSEEYEDAP